MGWGSAVGSVQVSSIKIQGVAIRLVLINLALPYGSYGLHFTLCLEDIRLCAVVNPLVN